MRIYRTSERAPCQMGTEVAQCSRPSPFNVGIRYSLGSGKDEKAGTIKSLLRSALLRISPLSRICQMPGHSFSCRLRLDTSKTRRVNIHTCGTNTPFCVFLIAGILHPAINCVAYFLCQLQLPHTALPPPLCPPSPPPSSLIEILPGTQTLPILGTKLRERGKERERETHKNLYQSSGAPVRCVCQAFIPSRGPRDQAIQ